GRPPPPGGGGKTGGPGSPPPPSSPSNQQAAAQRLKMIDAAYKKMEDQLKTDNDRLRSLGVAVADEKENAATPAAARAAAGAEAPLLDNSSVRLWSHDITAEWGKTYRYRVRVFLNNPVFGRTAALTPDQAELAKAPLMASADSEWSDQVTVDDNAYFFVTSAQEKDEVTKGPKASAEVYLFNL